MYFSKCETINYTQCIRKMVRSEEKKEREEMSLYTHEAAREKSRPDPIEKLSSRCDPVQDAVLSQT